MAEANVGERDAADVKIEPGRMPQVSFSTFILSLASSALVQLGEVPNPETEKIDQDLLMARHTIDILDMLQNKTRECLDPDESRLLEGVLYDLRLKYVLKTK
jgi:hypothetical protein